MDVYAANWNEADANNNTAAPDGAPEGMAASGVNDTMRAMMGATKRYVNQQSPKTTAGTSTAYTLAYGTAPGALVDGMKHVVCFNAANGDAPTLNVNSLGATPLHYFSAGSWTAVPAGLWAANAIFTVYYNSSAGAYRIADLPDRTGELVPFAGTTAPAGTLLCFGQAISRTAYVGLFTALSTTYGVGDGTTTFNLPDLRGRVAAGKDNMGGSAASRLTTAITGATLGATGGFQLVNSDGPNSQVAATQTTADINIPALAHIHQVSTVQPTIILNYIIRI